MKNLFYKALALLNREERRKFYALILLDILISLLDIVFLLILVFIIGFYTNNYHGDLPGSLISFMNQQPVLLTGLFLIAFSAKNLAGFFITRQQFRFIYNVASRISTYNLLAYLNGDYKEYNNTDSSIHSRRINQQPVEFSHYVLRGIQQIISNAVLIIFTVIPILFFNPLLLGLLFITLLPPALLTVHITRKKLAVLRDTGKKNREKTIQYLQEALAGYIESNLYQRKPFFVDRYRYFQEVFNKGLADNQIIQSLPARLMEIFAITGLFLLIIYHSFSPGSGSVQVLLIGGFIAAAYKVIPGIVKILNNTELVKSYAFTLTDLVFEQPVSATTVTQTEEPVSSIEFSKIHFGYQEEKVLTDFNMTLKKGDFLGLTGMSGKGKTTIINLLLGFLEPDSGSIFINQTPTTKTDRQVFWSRISYIKQQSFFIHDTVSNNITLTTTYEKEKMKRVLAVSGVDALFSNHPTGVETILSENGRNISGGQRQRIILARALYKEADLLILDEPFNELDRVAEDRLLNHFRELASEGKIVLFITHNQESLSFCNKIISLDEK